MSNTAPSIENILEQLKKTQTVTHIENVDITWDIVNQTVISNAMLLFLLTKVSCIPLVPDFTQPAVKETLGINNEQAKTIQNLNSELIYIHGLVQKVIIGKYVVSSICKQMFDETIDSLPQSEADMSDLLNFITNYNDVKSEEIQTGGNPIKKLIKVMVLSLFSFCAESASNEIALFDPSKTTPDLGIVTYSPQDFQQYQPISSGPIDIGNIVSTYDRETNTLFNYASSFLTGKGYNANALLQDFSKDWNKLSKNISYQIESSCIDLMQKSYDNGVFAKWKNIDTSKETQDKINDAPKQISDVFENAKNSPFANTASMKDDPQSTSSIIVDAANYVVNFFYNIGDTNNGMEDKTQPVVADMLYEYTRLYCSTGYNLRINVTDDTIQVLGGKVPYDKIQKLISQLNGNLESQISNLKSSSTKDDLIIYALDSIHQRLSVLKTITDNIGIIVNSSSSLRMMNENENPDVNSIKNIKEFFDSQHAKLKELLSKLNTKFPVSDQRKESEMDRLNQEYNDATYVIERNAKQADVDDQLQYAKNNEKSRKMERDIDDLNTQRELWTAFLQTWSDIGLTSARGVAKTITKFVVAPVEGTIDSVLEFGNGLLFKMISTPAGMLIIALTVIFAIGSIAGTIKLFVNAGKVFVTITTKTIVFVYQVIKTPFGYVFKQIATLAIKPDTDTQNENRLLTQPGGRKRKTRKTNKNKKNKTRTFRHGKKHRTRHIRRRFTSRR